MSNVKCQVEVLNKLIEKFKDHSIYEYMEGNVSLASYYSGIAEGLRRVRDGDFEQF